MKAYNEKPTHNSEMIIEMINVTVSLLNDAKSMFSSYNEKDYQRDVDCIKKRAANEGEKFFTHTITKISSGILLFLENNSSNYPNFARKGSFEYPAFLSGIFKLAYDIDAVDHIQAVGFLYQFGCTFKKLKGPYSKEVLRTQMEEFVRVDEQLELLDLQAEPQQLIIEHARSFITRLFASFQDDEELMNNEFFPKPGPGATNFPVDLNKRYIYNTIYQQIDSVFPYDEWFYSTYAEWAWDIPYYRKKLNTSKEYPTARFEFVHKTVGKARGICIEENEMQFFQQGVKRFLYKWLENHPSTRGHINFTNQCVNQRLALASSSSRTHATIDMSEASDRISRKLVRELFRDVPRLNTILDGLSTRYIDIGKYSDIGMLECNKFAPMGSGLCFPVMSLVHYALILSILYISMQPDNSLNEVYVYGDDIVLPSSCAQAVYDWLPRFGMKLNVEKSYVNSFFRESCGVHAYRGMDITPVYFKYTTRSSDDPTALASLISNEALLYTKGYAKTAAYVRRCKKLPYVRETSSACGWKRPLCYCEKFNDLSHYKQRWNEDLQCTEFFIQSFVVKQNDELENTVENEMYLRALTTQAHSHGSFWAQPWLMKRRVWLSHKLL